MSRRKEENKVKNAIKRGIKHLNVLQFQYGDRNRDIVSGLEEIETKFNRSRQVKKSKKEADATEE